jgi:Concanavalin A-like lectin/glucanases superfamily
MKPITILYAILAYSPITQAAVTSGLVGEWLFDQNILDSSGNGLHGTKTNTTLTTDRFGESGAALHFDGSGWVEIQDAPVLRPATSWTVSAWVRPETLTSPYNERIIDKGGDDYSGIPGYSLMYTPDRRFLFGNTWGGGDQGNIISLTQVQSSDWYSLVGTYDGLNARLYINGQLEAMSPMTWSIDSTKPVQIGRFEGNINPPHWTSLFNGSIDEIRIYDRAITPIEVTDLYLIPEPTTAILTLFSGLFFIARRKTNDTSHS